MAEQLYIEWADKTQGPVFYIPAVLLRQAIERKMRDQLRPATEALRNNLLAKIPDNKVAVDALIAMFGVDAGVEAMYVRQTAEETARLLETLARLEMVNRNLIQDATYVLDEAQLKEYGL